MEGKEGKGRKSEEKRGKGRTNGGTREKKGGKMKGKGREKGGNGGGEELLYTI